MRLTARGLRHRYAPRLPDVLADVDLTVGAGEVVAIVWPSGSGKTSLLALLGGLVPVQAGEVRVTGPDGHAYPPAAQVAWVLQTVNVLADRPVVDNVCLGAYSRGVGREEALRRARQQLAAVGLGDRGDDPVRVLSGGEVQRVVIARALASGRPVLLADEPTGQLDAATTDTVLSVLLDRDHGRSVVVVTHDLEVAGRCDRVLRLRDGVLDPDRVPG